MNQNATSIPCVSASINCHKGVRQSSNAESQRRSWAAVLTTGNRRSVKSNEISSLGGRIVPTWFYLEVCLYPNCLSVLKRYKGSLPESKLMGEMIGSQFSFSFNMKRATQTSFGPLSISEMIGFSLTRRFAKCFAIITPRRSPRNAPFLKELKGIPEERPSHIRTSVSFLERISTYVFILLRGGTSRVLARAAVTSGS
jgi:hypothetical protein